ncbi:RHS repeat-associated core domain-containing protein [Pseudomonas sp. nanlin1]|uniref:RHS repeat-associated core domain-containing protein n=1 Tax=Pseudomonas sp. nanlin1 TaxID=3040605 RepID=UPI00388F16FA
MPRNVSLLSTDAANSVLHGSPPPGLPVAYTVYGASPPLPWRAAFNGQYRESASELYMLGNGYRGYSPLLRRFYSPDSLSPFGEGGLNAYAYCLGDPINWVDPSGNVPRLLELLLKIPGTKTILKKLGRGRLVAQASGYTGLKSSTSANSVVSVSGSANSLSSGSVVSPVSVKGSERVTTAAAQAAQTLPVDNANVPILRPPKGAIELAPPPVDRGLKPPIIDRTLKPKLPIEGATESTHLNLDDFHRRVAAGKVITKPRAISPIADQIRKH